jgi:hypothetical protein
MEYDKKFESLTFDQCVNAIKAIGESKEVQICKKGSISPIEIYKNLQFNIKFEDYEFSYLPNVNNIVLHDNDSQPNAKQIMLGFNSQRQSTLKNPPFLVITKDNFGKTKIKLFEALLRFTHTYQQMKTLEDELENKNTLKKVNKIKI